MAKGKVPKSITVKIPKALRKARLVKSLLANKVDYESVGISFRSRRQCRSTGPDA